MIKNIKIINYKYSFKKVSWMLFDKTNPDNPWRKDNCAFLDWCCPDRPDWQKYCEFDQLCNDEGRIEIFAIFKISICKKKTLFINVF